MGKIPTQNLNHQEIKEANKDYVFNTKWWSTMKPWVNGGATGMIKTLPGLLLFSGAYYSTPFVWRFRHGQEKAAHLTKQLHNNQHTVLFSRLDPIHIHTHFLFIYLCICMYVCITFCLMLLLVITLYIL